MSSPRSKIATRAASCVDREEGGVRGRYLGFIGARFSQKGKKSQLVAIGFGWERSPARLRPEVGERGAADEWAPAISGPRR